MITADMLNNWTYFVSIQIRDSFPSDVDIYEELGRVLLGTHEPVSLNT